MNRFAEWSLARRQLAILASSLTLLALILGVGGSWYIGRFAERASDRVLKASVTSITETVAVENGVVTLDVPPGAFGMLEDNARDNVYYNVRAGPIPITGYPNFPAADLSVLQEDETHFRYERYLGQHVRVATQMRRLPRVRWPVVVQVAETLDERHALASSMLLGLIGLEAVLVGVAAILIRPAGRWGLKPVTRIQEELGSRPTQRVDFTPLSTGEVPPELRGLVDGFNSLLKRLEQTVAGVRQFTADASHQMRTPLAVLRTHIAVVRRYGTGSPEGQESLQEVEAAAKRLQRLLSQLLDLARAEDETSLEGDHVDACRISLIAAQTARDMAPAAVDAGIDIRFEQLADPVVRANRLVVSEVLINLIDNAIRYSGARASIVVRVLVQGAAAVMEVEDDGPGIPPDKRELVFRRFYRLDRDEHFPGSGLGLPIVRTLAGTLGATVEMTDGAGGRGLKISIVFSRAEMCEGSDSNDMALQAQAR